MTDYFALLEQPRRPWLDSDQLKQRFLALSADVHPDRVHSASSEARAAATQHFTALNAAYNCLKEPRDRLRHLVELELSRKPGDLKNVPNELADAFMKIAAASRISEKLATEKALLQSPLLLAGFFEKIQPHLDLIEQLQGEIVRLHSVALERLRALDVAWQNSGDHQAALLQLEELAQVLGFHARWLAQLQESHLRLTL